VFDASQTTLAAFERYEAVRHRLPPASFPVFSQASGNLSDTADSYDAFVLDAFGVLNIGETPIPGAVARMADLRAMGKKLVVLTNAASYTRAAALQKYRKLGFDFTADEVVSSRDVAASRLCSLGQGGVWAAISAGQDGFSDIPARVVDLIDEAAWDADGFLFLSSARWSAPLQTRLHDALKTRPRPLIVANPDIVAPREDGLTQEPGFFAHDLIDRLGLPVQWFGKPFPDAYAEAKARLPGIPAHRIAMVGDTLHTDVLGGAMAGMGTILITDHGLFRGHDVAPYITRSGIRPDVILKTT
jgi:glycerol-1-phosphatase